MEASTLPQRVILEINQSQLLKNYQLIQSRIHPVELISVIKADGYGLGIENIIPSIHQAEIKCLAFATLTEIVNFQKEYEQFIDELNHQPPHPYTAPQLLLLEDFLPVELPYLSQIENLTLPVNSFEKAQLLQAQAKKMNKKIKVALVIDTGIGRLGKLYFEGIELYQKILQLENLQVVQVYSHFSSADDLNSKNNAVQIERFLQIKKEIEKIKTNKINHNTLPTIAFHLSNSFGIQNFPQIFLDQVRLGVGAYGVYQEFNQKIGTKPVFQLKSFIISKNFFPAGFTLGYNQTYKLKRDSWIGTVSAGYSDGIPFALGSLEGESVASVLVQEKSGFKKASILGKISMDYFTIDLTYCLHEEIQLGDEVILLGGDENCRVQVEDWSRLKKSHPYDIMTSLNTKRMGKSFKKISKKNQSKSTTFSIKKSPQQK